LKNVKIKIKIISNPTFRNHRTTRKTKKNQMKNQKERVKAEKNNLPSVYGHDPKQAPAVRRGDWSHILGGI
jgi:hypothetical protein